MDESSDAPHAFSMKTHYLLELAINCRPHAYAQLLPVSSAGFLNHP